MSVWGFYGRNSSIEQASNYSLPTQREAAHEKARACGATHIIDFIDAGVPGDLDWIDRPELSRLLDLVEKHGLAGVVVYDPDRLARDLGVQLAVTDIFMKHGVRLEFCTQEFNASPEGVLFYQLRGAISQFERAKIRERTQRGRKKSLRSGIPTNAITTYGLEYDRPTNTWRIHETEGEVVKQIFAWSADGVGNLEIAKRLNHAGIPAPRGDRWWQGSINRMLKNEAYIGRFYLHRVNQEGIHKNRFLPKGRKTKVRIRPADEWVPVEVPALISTDVWEKVRETQVQNSTKFRGRRSSMSHMAAGLLRCGSCGWRMSSAKANRPRPRKPDYYYRCNGRYGERRLPCDMPHLKKEELETALWETVRGWLIHPERYRAAVEKDLRGKSPTPPHEDATRPILAEIRADIERLERLIQDGVVKEAEVRPALRSLRDREAALALALNRERAEEEELHVHEALPPEVVDGSDAAGRQRYVRSLVEEVIAYEDGRLEIVPRRKVRAQR